jgi:spore maturation protein CgeB
MRVLILNAMDPHTNPNPEIVPSVTEAFRRIGSPDDVAYATRWEFESVADGFQPDLILAVSCQIWGDLAAPLAVLRARQKAIVGCWLTDDPYEIDANLPRARFFDFVATNDLCSAGLYTGTSVVHVPLAADRSRHFREVRPADGDYEWDILFCGVAFSNRLAWIEAAKPVLARHKTLVLGPDWPALRFTSNRRVNNAELTDLYNSARIVLNLPRSYNIANECGFPASTPAPWTFEAALAGGFQLAAADRPEFHRHFEIPAEMDLFLNVRDLQAKIERYLSAPRDRINAARRAQQRTLESHLYEHRAAAIIEHVRGLRASHREAASPVRLKLQRAA